MKYIVTAILVCLILQGCRRGPAPPRYVVSVDTISVPRPMEKQRYFVVSGDSAVSVGSLQYREYEAYTKRALDDIGFIQAPTIDESEIVVFLSYGVGEPIIEQYTYTRPVYGRTGIQSTKTTGNIQVQSSNKATYSATSQHTYSYGVTGKTTHTGTRTSYGMHIVLDAIDYAAYQKTGKEEQVWRTVMVSKSRSGDLRRMFPNILGTSLRHIAENTHGQVTVEATDKSYGVRAMNGLPPY